MIFDFTKGKATRYMLSIYMPDGCNDQLYYHYYREAKAKYESLKNSGYYEKGTIISIYDMKQDVSTECARI